MNDTEKIYFIDGMIKSLRSLKSTIKQKEKESEKAFNMSTQSHSRKAIMKANADLNWKCMHLDKEITAIARMFKESFLDVETGGKEYRPSGFHTYKG